MSSFSFSGQVSYIQISMAIYIKGVQAYQKKIKKEAEFSNFYKQTYRCYYPWTSRSIGIFSIVLMTMLLWYFVAGAFENLAEPTHDT